MYNEGKNLSILSWEERLQISLDAAQGLRKTFVENTCTKGMRDVIVNDMNFFGLFETNPGLEYLHNGCKPPIVQRDVKPANILLNEKLQAKIADFGLSRSVALEGGSQVSTAVAGTIGYLDPE